ncbi:MAG: phage holin family protein [Saprospiraceae bacterium]|nr:phage holin family protein [Saprospiraceae bacterium]MBK8853416.1 phage holin family protein [Saprospiraceae bacterium]
MPFEELKNNIREIKENSEKYTDNSIRLIRLWIFKVFTKSVSLFIKFIFLILFVFLFIIFLSISLALFFAKITDSYLYGFLIVSGIYLLMILLIVYVKPRFMDKILLKNLSEIFFDD